MNQTNRNMVPVPDANNGSHSYKLYANNGSHSYKLCSKNDKVSKRVLIIQSQVLSGVIDTKPSKLINVQ